MVRITQANGKLKKLKKRIGKRVDKFDLLAGHTCPFARDCRSCVVDGKIVDGPKTEFRCFAASLEAAFPSTYRLHKVNTDAIKALKTMAKMRDAIQEALPPKAEVIRIHTSGDFFNQKYFDAWLSVARNNPTKIFYAYTKALPLWVRRKNVIPENFILTASYGGTRDDLIESENLRFSKVVFSREEAENLGLEIDENDFSAYNPETRNDSFALLLHGIQPKGSEAADALRVLNNG